jgi:SAM-dependent methyltransferase
MATFDPVWERRYVEDPDYRSYYPWSSVVSFVMREAPRDRPRGDVAIVEVGCGTASNLWFCAREGFVVAGIDASATAIEWARARFAEEHLDVELQVGDFTSLPFPDGAFDLCIDRAALSLTTAAGITRAIAEIHRVLRSGGRLLFTPYSDRCTSFYRPPDPDGVVRDISVGSITGGSQVRFYSLDDVRDLFANGWDVRSIHHTEETDILSGDVHADWRIVVEKM